MTADVRRMRRVLFVGPAPGRSGNPQRPILGGPSGDRLLRLLGIREEDAERFFAFANLADEYPGPRPGGKGDAVPPRLAMRDAAWRLISSHRWRSCPRVLLLGRDVALAFDFSRLDPYLRWFNWGPWRGRRVAIFPHPSGVDRWWNNPSNVEAARRFLREAAGLPADVGQGDLLAGGKE